MMVLEMTLHTSSAARGAYTLQYGYFFVVKFQILMPLKGCLA